MKFYFIKFLAFWRDFAFHFCSCCRHLCLVSLKTHRNSNWKLQVLKMGSIKGTKITERHTLQNELEIGQFRSKDIHYHKDFLCKKISWMKAHNSIFSRNSDVSFIKYRQNRVQKRFKASCNTTWAVMLFIPADLLLTSINQPGCPRLFRS